MLACIPSHVSQVIFFFIKATHRLLFDRERCALLTDIHIFIIPISQMFQIVPKWERKEMGTWELQAGDPSPAVNLFSNLEPGASQLRASVSRPVN